MSDEKKIRVDRFTYSDPKDIVIERASDKPSTPKDKLKKALEERRAKKKGGN